MRLQPRPEVAADQAPETARDADQSGATGPGATIARTVKAAAPTSEVKNVEASAAGATAASVMPEPTRTGLSSQPPPMP
jgi:hypothetical protein